MYSKTIQISAQAAKVWEYLTEPELMIQWMGEPEMSLNIATDWKIGSPMVVSGFHHVAFENRGIVMAFEIERKLKYSHLSSISKLPDKEENYTLLEFLLYPETKETRLTLNISNFPTVSIQKHLEFYWNTTILKIKSVIEQS